MKIILILFLMQGQTTQVSFSSMEKCEAALAKTYKVLQDSQAPIFQLVRGVCVLQ